VALEVERASKFQNTPLRLTLNLTRLFKFKLS
jgi:hypothetical protein